MTLKDIYMVDNRHLMLLSGRLDLRTDTLRGATFEEVLPPMNANITITSAFNQFVATTEADSDSQNFSLSASNCYSTIRIVAPTNYRLSLDESTWSSSIDITPTAGIVESTTIYVKLLTNIAGDYDGFIVVTAVGFTESVEVDGLIEQAITGVKYGFLYNWWVAQDASSKLIPAAMASEGWEVPEYQDYIDLILGVEPSTSSDNYYRGNTVGKKLKQEGTSFWSSPNSGTNIFSLNLRGSGTRGASGSYSQIKSSTNLITKTLLSADLPWTFQSTYQVDPIEANAAHTRKAAQAIRLVRPTNEAEEELDDGIIPGTYYIGNDGKVYRVTKIGTQVWLADNLAETKYNTGDYIDGYNGGTYTEISNAAWAALTTPALCAYNNDITNVLL